MEASNATSRAVTLSALLHLCIVGFLALAMLNCTDWETVADFLHLPNPVTCAQPLQPLVGPVIEATLVGPAAAPQPKHSKRAQPANPPPEQRNLPKPELPKPAPVKVLPPPPQHPDIKDQEKIADVAQQQAGQQKAGGKKGCESRSDGL